jgi:two-component system response regulator HupR/HoxA
MRTLPDRKSLFVPVMCLPALDGCWSMNINEEGMGLVAQPAGGLGPLEGETVDLDFPLPVGPRIRVRGVIRWRHQSEQLLEGGTTSLGVRFERFEGSGQLELRRFLAQHQLRVVVSGAPRGLERALELAFQGDVQLLFSQDPAEVERLLERGGGGGGGAGGGGVY